MSSLRFLVSFANKVLKATVEGILSRAQRAHCRLSWKTRLDRNARRNTAGQVTIKLFGVPHDFARDLGLSCERAL